MWTLAFGLFLTAPQPLEEAKVAEELTAAVRTIEG